MRLLFLCIVVVVTAQLVVAQSGRRKSPAPIPSPAPSPANQQPAETTEPAAPTKSSATTAQPRSAFHPAAFIITGKTTVEDAKSYGSDDVHDVTREIKFMFEFQDLPAKIVKGGKMTREKAIARAKQETDSYVLWLDIREEFSVVGLRPITTLKRVDYVLLMPGTGEVVRQFTVDPDKIVQKSEQGTPLPPRTQGRTTNLTTQLEHCAWEIARVLRYWL